MSELAAGGIPVAVTCRVLKIARQPYYRWLARPVTNAELEQAYRANALFDAHRDDPEFGYRFLVDEGVKPGVSGGESAELREARRRIKLLEQENEVLRRAAAYLSQASLPGKGSTRS